MIYLVALLSMAAPAADGQVSGIVVDHLTKQPLNHVLVQMTPVSKGLEEMSMLTTDNGAFLFQHVPYGKYQLSAQKRGQFPQAFRDDGFYGTAIVVALNQDTRHIVFDMRASSSLHGEVLGDDGNPIVNGNITLIHQAVMDGLPQTEITGTTRTSLAGKFHFSHLAPGNYYLAAEGFSWMGQPSATIYPITFYGNTREPSEARVIVLREGAAPDLQINLRAVPSIHFRLTDPEAQPILFAAGPKGAVIPISTLAGVSVDLGNKPGIGGQAPLEYTGLTAGRYRIQVLKNIGGQSRSQTVMDVELEDGATITPDSSPGCEVAGRVTFDPPVPSKQIRILFNPRDAATLQTNVRKDGTFHMGRIPAGAYDVILADSELLVRSISSQEAPILSGKVQIPAGGNVNLAITAVSRKGLQTLNGFALREQSSFPGAMVLLLPQDQNKMDLIRRDQSDSDGSFSMRDILPGRYTLVAINDGHDLAYREPDVIRPYLSHGVPVTVPLPGDQPISVQIQARLP